MDSTYCIQQEALFVSSLQGPLEIILNILP